MPQSRKWFDKFESTGLNGIRKTIEVESDIYLAHNVLFLQAVI